MSHDDLDAFCKDLVEDQGKLRLHLQKLRLEHDEGSAHTLLMFGISKPVPKGVVPNAFAEFNRRERKAIRDQLVDEAHKHGNKMRWEK